MPVRTKLSPEKPNAFVDFGFPGLLSTCLPTVHCTLFDIQLRGVQPKFKILLHLDQSEKSYESRKLKPLEAAGGLNWPLSAGMDAGILIMVEQVRLMMISLKMVDYSMSPLSLHCPPGFFFGGQAGGTF